MTTPVTAPVTTRPTPAAAPEPARPSCVRAALRTLGRWTAESLTHGGWYWAFWAGYPVPLSALLDHRRGAADQA